MADPRRSPLAWTIATCLAAGTFGLGSVWLASRPPALALPAMSIPATVVTLLAGSSLLAVGIWSWWRSRSDPVAKLAIAAGISWYLAGWSNPGTGSAVVFTTGLALGALTPAVVAHLGLAFPQGRLGGFASRTCVAAGYGIGLLGLGIFPALFLDPASTGCSACPQDLLAVARSSDMVRGVATLSILASAAVAGVSAVLALAGLSRATPPARTVRLPVVFPAAAYLAAFAIRGLHDAPSGFLGLDDVDGAIWTIEGLALIALALGIAARWLRARRVRSRIATLVVEMAQPAPPGGVREVLSSLLADPQLMLAYPTDAGRYVDLSGATIDPSPTSGRMITPLVRGEEVVALLDHSASVGDDPDQLDEALRTAHLAIDNERLTALARARVEEVRETRRRVVTARDAERRRLERDLHDGAQQRLVALAIELRLRRGAAGSDGTEPERAFFERAEGELSIAIDAVRDIGHGVYPSLLAEEGLAAAVDALSEESPARYEILAIPEGRFGTAVESAAYDLIAEAPIAAGATRVTVRVEHQPSSLILRVTHDGDGRFELGVLAERVAALGGRVSSFFASSGLVVLEAELPCAS